MVHVHWKTMLTLNLKLIATLLGNDFGVSWNLEEDASACL